MPKKPENSVILPHVDVRADIDAINLGQAERVGGDDPERLALQMSRQAIGETEQRIAASVFKLYRKG